MRTLKNNYVVQKRNILNEIRTNSMTLQELRFFSIYLSKINSKDLDTRVVRFTLNDFRAIMELGSRIKIDYMKQVTDKLLCKIMRIPLDSGGYLSFQLFKECRVDIDEKGEWYVEIDAHDKALPFLFEFKSCFFSYQLWNALRLRSSNQLRMYEILKQYEKMGCKVWTVDRLKELIGVASNEYPRFGNFKNRVLDACQEALQENTDLKFTYEPYGKRGRGGKILELKFTIEKNKDYVDRLTLEQFIDKRKFNTIDVTGDCVELNNTVNTEALSGTYCAIIELLSDACDGEFSFEEVELLFSKMRLTLESEQIEDSRFCYHYLFNKYKCMNLHSKKTKIFNRFKYFCSMLD